MITEITKYNVIPREERVKIPFFFRMMQADRNKKYFRKRETGKKDSLISNKRYFYNNFLTRNKRNFNIVALPTYYNKEGLPLNVYSTSSSTTRSLNSVYAAFCGYYELDMEVPENFIRMFKEMFEFQIFILEDFLDYYDKGLVVKNYKKMKKSQSHNFESCCIPIFTLLLCPDIGRYTIRFSSTPIFSSSNHIITDLEMLKKRRDFVESFLNKLKSGEYFNFVDFRIFDEECTTFSEDIFSPYGFSKEAASCRTYEEIHDIDGLTTNDYYLELFNESKSLTDIMNEAL